MNGYDQPRSTLADVLRWIATLPIAAFAAYVAYLFMGWFGLTYADIRPDSIFCADLRRDPRAWLHGCRVRLRGYVNSPPRFQDAVSFVLAVLAIAAAGFLAFPAYLTGNWWALVGAVSVAVGAGVSVW